MAKYRLDEPIFRGRSLKRAVWIEEIIAKSNDYIPTENYLLIDLWQLLAKGKFVVLRY